jgi:hypothetical protein
VLNPTDHHVNDLKDKRRNGITQTLFLLGRGFFIYLFFSSEQKRKESVCNVQTENTATEGTDAD